MGIKFEQNNNKNMSRLFETRSPPEAGSSGTKNGLQRTGTVIKMHAPSGFDRSQLHNYDDIGMELDRGKLVECVGSGPTSVSVPFKARSRTSRVSSATDPHSASVTTSMYDLAG